MSATTEPASSATSGTVRQNDPGFRGPGIVLIGLMGAGKSTVGRLLAQATGLTFVDLDALVEERAGTTIGRIFAEQGEPAFRQLELEALQALLSDRAGRLGEGVGEDPGAFPDQGEGRGAGSGTRGGPGLVLATGGGAPCREAAWPLLRRLGMVVWLQVDPAQAVERLLQKSSRNDGSREVAMRPLLASALLEESPGGDAEAAMLTSRLDQLLAARSGWYARADLHLPTAGATPVALAQQIAEVWRCRRAVRTVRVDVAPRSYEVKIGRGLMAGVGQLLRELFPAGSALLVSNPTVANCYGETVRSSLERAGFSVHQLLMDDGEEHKNLETVRSLYEGAAAARAERGWPVVALGGGVVGDTAGFFAATYLRGLPFVQVPTTLLAQVDASVGGKVGVDLPEGKNLVGAFYQPRAVIVDPEALASLPPRQLRSGLAEVLKTAALDGGELLDLLAAGALESLLSDVGGDRAGLWERVLELSIAYKARVVEADERETGGPRMFLNLGHTVGHALETMTGYRTYTHGEAVAIGTVVALRLSRLHAGLPPEQEEKMVALLQAAGLPLVPATWEPETDWARLASLLLRDKKVRAGEVNFVLLRSLGAPLLQPLSLEAVRQVLNELWPGAADAAPAS